MTAVLELRRGADSAGERIIGDSPALRRAVGIARRFAPTGLPILLKGATGTGKELFAKAIHQWSAPGGPLVDVNCATLPKDMADSLLFGHRRGAFTGAVESLHGLVEEANRGTLFLDEVLSLERQVQGKLLRVLETGEVRRVGETSKRSVRFRTVSAVQEDLEERVRGGEFRMDLLQRLARVVIELPRLVDRGDDVSTLANWFAALHQRGLTPCAQALLGEYDWPGNVRELGGVIERAVFLTGDSQLDRSVIQEAMILGIRIYGRESRGRDCGASLDREALLDICRGLNWDAPKIAAALGVGRTKLFGLLKRSGVSLRRGRASWMPDVKRQT